MPDWTSKPPRIYDIVTGFFPEAQPKDSWADNPRPLLVTGVFRNKSTLELWVRVAYGTGEVGNVRGVCLNIGNLSHLDNLRLAKPTAFVLTPGSQHAILPWTKEFFCPWRHFSTPVISSLPPEMREYVKGKLAYRDDLPFPPKPSPKN